MPCHLVGDAAEVAERRRRCGGRRDFSCRESDARYRGVSSFAKIGRVGFDRVRQFQQQTAAVGRRHALPRGKCFARGRDRAIDIGRARFGDLRQKAVVVRVVDGNESALGRGDELTSDE